MNARDVSGMTPLMLASKAGHQDVSYNLQSRVQNPTVYQLYCMITCMQVVLKLMEKRLQQLQSTEEVDAGVLVETNVDRPEQSHDPSEELVHTEVSTNLWALRCGISTYFEVTDTILYGVPMQ